MGPLTWRLEGDPSPSILAIIVWGEIPRKTIILNDLLVNIQSLKSLAESASDDASSRTPFLKGTKM